VLILIRSSLLALDQANKTGNYTVLRDLGAPGFQTNSAARLGEIFAKLRNDNLDLSGVAVIDPQLNLLPQIEANGLMHMAGFFPSVPSQVNFDLSFAPVSGNGGCSASRSRSDRAGLLRPTRPRRRAQNRRLRAAPSSRRLQSPHPRSAAPPENKPADSQQPK